MKEIKTGKAKPIAAFALTAALIGSSLSLTACGESNGDVIVLRVANWEEYIDEGDWDDDEVIELADGTEIFGENSLIDDFEEWYEETYGKEVRVEYSAFGTNEAMYNQLNIGDTFDLLCPSEYMIMKLIDEDKLTPYSESFWDTSIEENYYAKYASPYIRSRLDALDIDGCCVGDYAACYMCGTLGFVYNPDVVSDEEASTWALLLNDKYYKQVTAKDSVRDCYFAAMGLLNEDLVSSEEFRAQEDYSEQLKLVLNDTSEETVDKVRDILTQVKDNAYSLETDSGKADLVTGKVVANLQWSGDAVYSMDQAEEDGVYLKYAAPESCTNLWFAGWVMLKDGINDDPERRQAAEAFVNFLSFPENAVRNMYYIGYTSAISGNDEDDTVYQYIDYCYGDEEADYDYDISYFFGGEDGDYVITTDEENVSRQLGAQYPSKDVINRSAIMNFFDKEANARINRMWIDIRCFHF